MVGLAILDQIAAHPFVRKLKDDFTKAYDLVNGKKKPPAKYGGTNTK